MQTLAQITTKATPKTLLVALLAGVLPGCLAMQSLAVRPAEASPGVRVANRTRAIVEENLNPDSMEWAARGLPLEDATDIQDTLVNTVVGRVAIDRHTLNRGNSGPLSFTIPGLGPWPGSGAVITVWGSKIEGCFVEVFYQLAPESPRVDPAAITPTLLEIGVGQQAIELSPQQTGIRRIFQRNYTYTRGGVQQQGVWFATRNLFRIDAQIAGLLANAPAGEVRGRITLANGERVFFTLEEKTVSSWKQVYSFNPTCISPQVAQNQTRLAERPLINACRAYRNTPAQVAALNWLQAQATARTLSEFSRQWRMTAQATVRPVSLVDACRFYRNFRNQNAALDWLQTKYAPEVLGGFIQKWD